MVCFVTARRCRDLSSKDYGKLLSHSFCFHTKRIDVSWLEGEVGVEFPNWGMAQKAVNKLRKGDSSLWDAHFIYWWNKTTIIFITFSMTTVITGDQIHKFRQLALLKALSLEIKGLKGRFSAYATIKKEFNLRGSRESVYKQFEQIVKADWFAF